MKAFGQPKPKTLTALFLHLLSTATFSLLLLWVFTIISTRVYIFHNAYIHHLQTVEDELWIREQCKDPEFYAHLAAHSVLCQNVFENARKNTLLVALNETVSTASACGTVGCWELLAFVQSGGLSLVATVSIVLLAVVTVVFPSLNIISKWLRERDAWSRSSPSFIFFDPFL
jgi:hypothetical protein